MKCPNADFGELFRTPFCFGSARRLKASIKKAFSESQCPWSNFWRASRSSTQVRLCYCYGNTNPIARQWPAISVLKDVRIALKDRAQCRH